MTTMEGKALLLEVLGEIEQADPGMFSPPQELSKHDKKLFTLEDTYIKKLYALSAYYAREAEILKAKLKFEPNSKEMQIEFSKCDAKDDLLRELLCFTIRTKFELWKYPKVGVRKDWTIVNDDRNDDDDGPPEFLKRLLEM